MAGNVVARPQIVDGVDQYHAVIEDDPTNAQSSEDAPATDAGQAVRTAGDSPLEGEPAVPADFADELKPGTKLLHGQYVIESFLNSGGFGITYLARDSLDRQVVIKECFPGSFCRRSNTIVRARSRAHHSEFRAVVRLFVQEARSLAKLGHPNIVGVHQVFEDNDTAYMAIDYVKGRDLLEIIEDPSANPSPDEIVGYLRKLLGAVQFIHDRGMLHRDISPDNILIDISGAPVLIDFGAAREQASKASRALSALRVVKDGYSPQEFYIAGSVQGPSSDLYALAASFYHLIAGETPPDSQRRLSAIADDSGDPYVPLAGRFRGYPPGFLEAIDKAVRVLPRDRIGNAQQWLEMLDAAEAPARLALRPLPSRTLPEPTPQLPGTPDLVATKAVVRAPRQGGAAGTALAAAGAALALIGGIYFMLERGPAPERVAVSSAVMAPAPLPATGKANVAFAVPEATIVATSPRIEARAGAAAGAAVQHVALVIAPAAAPLPKIDLSASAGDAFVATGAVVSASAMARPLPPPLPSPIASTRWEMSLPFVARAEAFGINSMPVVDEVLASAAGLAANEWLAEGVVIYSVNETWVSDQASIERAVFGLPGNGGAAVVVAGLRIRHGAGGQFAEVSLAVPGKRWIELVDGTVLSCARVDGAWQAVVESVPAGETNGLAAGDVLLGERQTGQTFFGPRGVESVLERLARRGVEEALLSVRRGGAEIEIALPLGPAAL